MRRLFVFLALFLLVATASAQRKVKLKQADALRGSMLDGVRVDRAIGNVIFVQNQTTIYCDSATFNKSKNTIDAYGHIRIVDGDSVTVTANRLTYDGNKKIAYLRKNVVFNKLQTATLYTDFLDYDRPRNLAKYFNKGKLVD